MANLKNITELPVAESAEGLNLIVNDNGAAKQIPADEISGVASWNDLTDKPFGTKPVQKSKTFECSGENYFDFNSIKLLYEYRKTAIYTVQGVNYVFEKDLESPADAPPADSWLIKNENGNTAEVILTKDLDIGGYTGVIIFAANSSITINYEVEDVYTLDEKFIPDSVKSGVYVIDISFSPAPNTGKLAKEALLNGKNIFIYNGTYYFLVASFKINETTDGRALLTLYTSHSSSTTGGVSSLAQEWSFVIFD